LRLFTFWSFAPTTYVEHLCLKSMLAAGHPIDLYTYDEDVKVPDGVAVRDAAEIFPKDQVIFHQSGSAALFSDLFRYAGLKRALGTWIDADVLLLRSIADLDDDHVFGWETPGLINGAILKLPANSPLFAYVDKLVHARVPVPPYWPLRKKIRQLARACVGRHRPLERLDWGVIGPKALTHFARKNGLAKLAQPSDVFYPLGWRDAPSFFDPAARIESRFTARTRAVHLYNFQLREHKLKPPPPGSFIPRMCERYGVEYDIAPSVERAPAADAARLSA
jgi:hypothetical protein